MGDAIPTHEKKIDSIHNQYLVGAHGRAPVSLWSGRHWEGEVHVKQVKIARQL